MAPNFETVSIDALDILEGCFTMSNYEKYINPSIHCFIFMAVLLEHNLFMALSVGVKKIYLPKHIPVK